MKKMLLIVVISSILISTISAQGASEKENKSEYLLRFGNTLTPDDEFNKGMNRWATAVKEKTGGNLNIEIYPSGQLGIEEDVLEQVKQGTNIGWQTDPARLGNYVKEWSIFYAPFFLSGLEDVQKLRESKEIEKWKTQLEEEYNIKVISFSWVQGYRNIFANQKGYSPNDLKGMLIRTASAPMWVATINSLGCKAVALPYGDIYNAIQTKVVDGCELPYAAAKASNIHEVAKYIIETNHIFQLNAMIVSADWFEALPTEYQKILVDECDNAGLNSSEILLNNADKNRQFMIDQGLTVIPHSDLDMDAFKESAEQVYEKMGLMEIKENLYKELGK